MNWDEIEFGELYAIPSKNGLTRPSRVRGSGYKMINMGELFAHDRIDDVPMELVPMNEQELATMLVEPGDLLFARQSLVLSGAGKCSLVTSAEEPTTFESHIIRVRLKNKIADPSFFHYYFKSPICRMRSIVTQGVQAGIRGNDLKRLKVHVPPLSEQRRIASILSAYDDLIENNRRRIQLLEQSARLLYKEWFVHLRFPGHEHTKIIDSVPEGWERKTYADIFDFLLGFPFKSKTYLTKGRYGIVTIKNVHNARFVPECSERLDTPPEKMKKHCLLKTGDILLSLTGNIGRSCIVYGNNYLLNQRIAKVVGRSKIPTSYVYWTFSNDSTQKELENLAYGVAQLNLSPVKLGKCDLLKPAQMLLNLFAETADPIFSQICYLNLQNKHLAKARDLLLPKLMNGEVAV